LFQYKNFGISTNPIAKMDTPTTPTNRTTTRPKPDAPRKRHRSDTVESESMNTDNSQLTTPTNRPTTKPKPDAPKRKASPAVRSCPKFDSDDAFV